MKLFVTVRRIINVTVCIMNCLQRTDRFLLTRILSFLYFSLLKDEIVVEGALENASFVNRENRKKHSMAHFIHYTHNFYHRKVSKMCRNELTLSDSIRKYVTKAEYIAKDNILGLVRSRIYACDFN
jgi:hypothetical protein